MPLPSFDVPSMDPTRPQTEKPPTFLNILNKEALLRIAQVFLIIRTRVLHALALYVAHECICTAIHGQILAYLSIQQ